MTAKGICTRSAIKTLLGAVTIAAVTATATGEMRGDTIRIGVLTDVNGAYSESAGQGSQIAAELAVEDMSGAIGGTSVEVIIGDTRNDPDTAVEQARHWHDQGIDLITGMPGSAVALAVQAFTREEDIATIHIGAGSEQLTGEQCSPVAIDWQYNVRGFTTGMARALAEENPAADWYLITLDHPFGHDIRDRLEEVLADYDGELLDTRLHPFDQTDFMATMADALASGADIIAVGNAGTGLVQSIRHAHELGVHADAELASVMTLLQDIRQVGLYAAADMRFIIPYYWNADEATRAFTERFQRRSGSRPSSAQIAVYVSTLHYLKAVEASGHSTGPEVVATMREMEVDDGITRNGSIRDDGRLVHDMPFVRVRQASEMERSGDYFEILDIMPGATLYGEDPDPACPFL